MSKLILSIALFLFTSTAEAALNAAVDRTTVYDGDSFQLTLTLDEQSSSHPDTTVLSKDFEVLGTAKGSSVQVINGRTSSKTTWTISLQPKAQGMVTIPALSIDGQSTRPLTVRVIEPPQSAGAERDIFIETSVSKSAPYVQEMLTYTVKIYFSVELSEGSLADPVLDNVVLQRLGEDSLNRENRGGRNYQVIERRYALFPQASGKLEIPPVTLNGKIPDTRNPNTSRQNPFSNDPFFNNSRFGNFFVNTRPVRIRSEKKEITVLPPPDDASSAYWLPTPQLILSETWDIPKTPAVGAPITRTITVRARNLAASQLPKFDTPSLDNAGVYADKASESTSASTHGVDGLVEQRIVYVPNQPGALEIPEISIPWWNTETMHQQIARLPAKNLEILPTPGSTASASIPALTDSSEINQSQNRTLDSAEVFSSTTDTVETKSGLWPLVAGFFALLWILTLALWQRDRRQRSSPKATLLKEEKSTLSNSNSLRRTFQEACELNDAQAARNALMHWAEQHWVESPPSGVSEIAKRINEAETIALLNELDAAVYSERGIPWRGKSLADRLKKLPREKLAQDTNIKSLPTLFSP